MKTLIYELFSGVGFCNQLFSLETAIYLSNIMNRKLILIIKWPLCHCGRTSWDYGKFLDFFSDNYKQYLKNGLEVYYGNTPQDITNIINSDVCKTIPFINRFSQIVMVDKDLDTIENKESIRKFCNYRKEFVIDFNSFNEEFVYTNMSNASRCFYNFFTTQKNYELMSKICESLTHLHESFNFVNTDLDYKYISIHLRLGDCKFTKKQIDNRSNGFYEKLKNQLNKLISKNKLKSNEKMKVIVMYDRNDSILVEQLKKEFNIINTEEILNSINYKEYFNNISRKEVVEFLIQKKICENSECFIGYEGSTVSNHIQYKNYLVGKSYYLYADKTVIQDPTQKTWNVNPGCVGGNIAFRLFFPDNIHINTNLKLITLTNTGYKDLTDNLLCSMKKLGIEKLLKIYCIGEECYDYFKKEYPFNDIEQIDTNEDYLSTWVEYKSVQNKDIEGKKKWAKITSYKMYCIYNELIKGNDIIFTDGDIVFEKNPFCYLQEHINDCDLLIQNDNQTYNDKAFCTGFFYMKSNDKTKEITNFDKIQKNIDSYTNDQQYLRRYEKQLNVKYLPLDLFPNGKYWREKKPEDPFIIHFNYDVSHHKIRRMKQFNKWYLEQNIKPKQMNNTLMISHNVTKNYHTENRIDKFDLTTFIEQSGAKIRQGFITQDKNHESKILKYIKHYFSDIKKINNVLEIGFLAGHSAEMFLKINKELNITSFDLGTFQSIDIGKQYIDMKYPNRHKLIKGDSKKTILEFIKKQPKKFDIILIDGGYEYETVVSDITNCKYLAHPDTLLIVNNVLHNNGYIKYWNKEPTKIWNKLVNDKVVIKKEHMDINTGRGSVIGKYI